MVLRLTSGYFFFGLTVRIDWSLEHLQKLLPADRWEAMEQASCNPNVHMNTGGNYPIIHAETGNLLAGVPFARGLRVPRSKMRALCAEGIDVQASGLKTF